VHREFSAANISENICCELLVYNCCYLMPSHTQVYGRELLIYDMVGAANASVLYVLAAACLRPPDQTVVPVPELSFLSYPQDPFTRSWLTSVGVPESSLKPVPVDFSMGPKRPPQQVGAMTECSAQLLSACNLFSTGECYTP
jgi:hypothetical protein